MAIAVTGGTGFLGSALTKELLERGHEVRIVSRSRGFDITRPESLGEVFRDARTVFHLAALVQSRPGPFEETNQTGLENVLKACISCGVHRFVYVSSFTVFGPSGDDTHTEARMPQRSRFFHDYEKSKFEALRIAKDWRSKIPMNIIFPTVILGPGPVTEGNILARLFARWFRFGLATLPGRGFPIWNFVYVDDVVQGLLAVTDQSPGEDYILGGPNATLSELARLLNEISSKKLHILGLPNWLFRISCYGEDWASRMLRFKPLVLPETADFLINNWKFSSSKAKSELGYEPHELKTALELTYRWMKEVQII
jgi:farnesol dehydrogenase